MEESYDLLAFVDSLEEALRLVRVQKLSDKLSDKIEFIKVLGRSINNINSSKRATIIGFRANEDNPMATEMVRVYCTLEGEETEVPVSDQMRRFLEKGGGKG